MSPRAAVEPDDFLAIDIAEDMEREFQPERKTTMAMTEAYDRDPRKGALLGTGKMDPTVKGRPSIADTLESAVSALRDTAVDLIALADRLCGPVPEGKGAELRGVADGVFSQIDAQRTEIEAITEIIATSISRIRGRI